MSQAQLQFGKIVQDGIQLNNVPRIGWQLPFLTNLTSTNNTFALYGGVTIKNQGVIYDYDGDRYKKRGIGAGPEFGFVNILNDRLLVTLGFGLDYYFHYKEKIFVDGKRKNKQIQRREWGSDRINKVNYFARVGIGKVPGVYLYVDYYFEEFMNRNFTENINGIESKPFENFEVQPFNIGFGFFINRN